MSALMLKTVFQQTQEKYRLKLLAGESGMHRSLRWLYFSEDIRNADFMRGGELMVLTGYNFANAEELTDFINMIIEKNACGVIINVGKYIFEENIPPALLRRCDEAAFPLITMPWECHLTEILQDYSRQIFFRSYEQDRLIHIFKTLLKDARLLSAEDAEKLAARQFHQTGSYCVALLACKNQGEHAPTSLQTVATRVEMPLNQGDYSACVFPYKGQLLLLYHGVPEARVGESLDQIQEVLTAAFPGTQFFCGVGSALEGAERLRESYERARSALQYGMDQKKNRMRFEEMEVFQLFFSCRDKRALRQFTQVLAPLEDYDAQYGGQLTETLYHYLRFQGSVNLVSDEMYCHRNTTNYRMKRIKSILGSDLDSSDMLFRLQLAFYIREYWRFAQEEN